jgi:hypothetical protein
MPRERNPSRVIVPVRKRGVGQVQVEDGSWWALATKKQRGAAAWATVELLNKAHMPRHMEDALMRGLYDNRPPYWAPTRQNPMLNMAIEYGGRRVPLNLVKSVIDTARAQIAKNAAELRAYTSGGSWHDQKKAKQITAFTKGAFYLQQFHRHQQRAFVDGCLTRARGAVKFWADEKSAQIRCGRAHPRTLLWNELEGDAPRSFYQWSPVARETVIRAHPNHEEMIRKCPPSVNPVNPAYRKVTALHQHADMIDVAEAWHLGYRGEEDSGCHLLMVEKGPLVDEPWPHEFFPFAFFSWDDQDEGWGGSPLADILSTYQVEINRHIRIYRKALERAAAMAGPWVEETSGAEQQVQGENNNGEPWTPRKYRGQPPVFAAPPALGKDFFEYVLFQYDKAFAEAGFNMLQAQGEKPTGIDSAPAQREYNDITATRQVPIGQRYERQTEDAGEIDLALGRKLYAGKNKVSVMVRAPGTKFLQQTDFADIADVEEDAYILRQSATSSLPTHFVGKMQTVVEMIRGGLLPEEQVKNGLGLRLLQMPDLEKEIDIETAQRELTSMQVDEALYEGRYIPPQPYQSMDLLIQVAQNSIMFALTMKDVPPKNMRLLERLISEANAMKKRAVAGQMSLAGPGAQAMQPGAPPSLMLPSAPAPVQQVINETPAVPVPQPTPLPVPAVPSTALAMQ